MAEDMRKKQHIILVHGACHGAWSWFKVATRLKSAGYHVTVPDLAASGTDLRRIEEVPTIADYSQPLLEIMASLPSKEKVILVGHSLGGFSIALAADMFPEKIAAVVFVSAFMPDCTSSPVSAIKPTQQYLKFKWMDTQFCSFEVPGKKPFTSMLFGPKFMASMLYQLCSKEDVMLASTLIRPSSMFIEDLESKPAFSKDRYGSVSRFYIVCLEDATIVKDNQYSMIHNYPVKQVFEIEGADHMSMFSRPQELIQALVSVAQNVA